jgi:uncharacterized protein
MSQQEDYPAAFLAKAREAIETARHNSDATHQEAAVNRAYYAAFYAACAAVYRAGEAPRSHKGVRTRFFELYVRPGHFDQPTASILSAAAEARRTADYDAFSVFDRNAARDLIADVERFVSAVERLLAGSGVAW